MRSLLLHRLLPLSFPYRLRQERKDPHLLGACLTGMGLFRKGIIDHGTEISTRRTSS